MIRYSSEPKTIKLSSTKEVGWEEDLIAQLRDAKPTDHFFDLDCNDVTVRCKSIKRIQGLFDNFSKSLITIKSNMPETIISAAALGYKVAKNQLESHTTYASRQNSSQSCDTESKLLFKQGTLRSGENLVAEGDVLLLGDINPGASVSAGGNVMVWGRLRGNAYAGKFGDFKAKIIALELRPVQLRIANKIARGPEEKPEQGFTEEAVIENDQIIIRPVRVSSFNRQ